MEERHYRGVVWPVLLIGAGLILLLNNMGYLSWDIWGVLWRLWPVLLIAAGLEILIGRRSFLGSVAVALLLLAALFGIIMWGLREQPSSPFVRPPLDGAEAEVSTVEISQSLQGADAADIDIRFGAGQLRLEALPESSRLVEGQIELRDGEQASPTFEMRDGTGYFKLHSQDPVVIPTLGQWESNATWELGLNRDVPTVLAVSTGAGEAKLDLSELNLERLKVETSVGSTQLYLPRRGRLSAAVDTGVGELDIIIPTGMAARIRVDRGLGSIEVRDKDYRQEEDVYVSPGFEGAVDRVDLEIDAGIGKVIVR
jgi:hypothetical protein